MKVINISDSKKRNTRVLLKAKNQGEQQRMTDPQGRPVKVSRFVRNTLETDLTALTKETSLEDLSEQIIAGDPEIDMELFGRRIDGASRLYLNANNEPAYGVHILERVMQPDGSQKEERDFEDTENNINQETPIKWTGKLISRKEACKKFVFGSSQQLTHVDGLSFDFLFNMAKELEEKDAMLFVGGGEKGNKPLILSRNGTPYRGLLEGRTEGERYLLILHLTNLELKAPPTEETA
jgi:hypothetical protein